VSGTIFGPLFGEITNHLWQSTIFALAAALLTLACRRNRAQVRYWLWLSASLKFLIPFALLIVSRQLLLGSPHRGENRP